jgi:hypothetical protein
MFMCPLEELIIWKIACFRPKIGNRRKFNNATFVDKTEFGFHFAL